MSLTGGGGGGTSTDPFHQSCLRETSFIAVRNDFVIKTQHTRGEDNRIADILSRWHLYKNSEVLLRENLGGVDGTRIPVNSSLFHSPILVRNSKENMVYALSL